MTDAMGNPDDIALFECGVDAWNEVIEHRLYGTPGHGRFVADLSNAHLGREAMRRADPDGPVLGELVSYPRAEFGFCDLRGTDFGTEFVGFDFRRANFGAADLEGANFSGSDLSGARLAHANLGGVKFCGAKLDGADLGGADLTEADLTASAPWRAQLFDAIPPDVSLEAPVNRTVSSVADLVSICAGLRAAPRDVRLYYRGESAKWRLRPSIMRSRRLRASEGAMLTDLVTRRPSDFGQAGSALDQWVLAQQNGLKTRLLDVTRNPLVALFFACERDEHAGKDGRIHVLAAPPSLIRTYDSDALSVVANFAKLSHAEQSTLLGKRRCAFVDYGRAMDRLYHRIAREKPGFERRIDPRDLFRVFVLEPRRSFERLAAQAGAFVVSAFHERFERAAIRRVNDLTPVYEHFVLKVPASCKPKILDELEGLDITRDALFPSLSEAAKSVNEDQRSRVPYVDRQATGRTWRQHQVLVENPPRAAIPPDRMPRILEITRHSNESL